MNFLLCGLLLSGIIGGVQSGDSSFVAIQYVEALAQYESSLLLDEDDAEVLWRLARLHVCLGDVADEEKSETLYRKAEEYARRSIHSDSTISSGYTWLAAALGNIAMFEGSKTKIVLSIEIKTLLERAVVLNPDDDIAHSILGTFYMALGGISWVERPAANLFLGDLPDGGYEEAEVSLVKAVSLAPNTLRHQFELGILYMRTDRKEEAHSAFESARKLPVTIASDRRRMKRIPRLIESLSN